MYYNNYFLVEFCEHAWFLSFMSYTVTTCKFLSFSFPFMLYYLRVSTRLLGVLSCVQLWFMSTLCVSTPIIESKPLTTSYSSVKGEARHRFTGHISGADPTTSSQNI